MENLTMISRNETMVRLGRRLAHVKSEIEGELLDELIMMYRAGVVEVLFDDDGEPHFQLTESTKSIH